MLDTHSQERSTKPPLRFVNLLCALLPVIQATSGQAAAGRIHSEPPNPTPQCHVRPQDEIWMISTRNLPISAGDCPRVTQPKYCRYRPCDGWQEASEGEFFAGDDSNVITTIYVHGNRMNMPYVYDRGFQIYCEARCGLTPEQPIRHVIWSWPSARVTGPVCDFRIKAWRTPLQSFYLSSWLAKMNPQVRVSLMGYSYGGRVILGALHLLAGGELEGRCLATTAFRYDDVPRCRVALWAAALQSDWLLSGRTNGCAMQVIDRLLIMYNPRDPVLRTYWRLTRNRHSRAMGRCGVSCRNQMGEAGNRISQINANPMVGGKHEWERYVESLCLMNSMRRYIQWHLMDGFTDVPTHGLSQRPMAAPSGDGNPG